MKHRKDACRSWTLHYLGKAKLHGVRVGEEMRKIMAVNGIMEVPGACQDSF